MTASSTRCGVAPRAARPRPVLSNRVRHSTALRAGDNEAVHRDGELLWRRPGIAHQTVPATGPFMKSTFRGASGGGVVTRRGCEWQGKHLDELRVTKILCQIILALKECHGHSSSAGDGHGAKGGRRPILHRDLKPANVSNARLRSSPRRRSQSATRLVSTGAPRRSREREAWRLWTGEGAQQRFASCTDQLGHALLYGSRDCERKAVRRARRHLVRNESARNRWLLPCSLCVRFDPTGRPAASPTRPQLSRRRSRRTTSSRSP